MFAWSNQHPGATARRRTVSPRPCADDDASPRPRRRTRNEEGEQHGEEVQEVRQANPVKQTGSGRSRL